MAPSLKCFFRALLGKLSEAEVDEVRGEVSEELKSTDSDATIRLALRLLPADFWPQYDEVARLRIENKLLSDIKRGRYDASTKRSQAGALGTWGPRVAAYFVLKDELIATLLRKLASSDRGDQAYVFQYFFQVFPKLMDVPSRRYIHAMRTGLQSGNTLFRDALSAIEYRISGEEDPWLDPFVEDFESFAEGSGAVLTEDDIPF